MFVFFTKYTLLAEEKNLYAKKLYIDFFLLEKLYLKKMKKIYISFEKYFFYQKIYIHSAKKEFLIIKNMFDKIYGELNNLVLQVSEAPNMWYSLN